MTVSYFVKTGECRRCVSYGGGDYDYEWDGDEGYEVEYTFDRQEIITALIDILSDEARRKCVQEIGNRKLTADEKVISKSLIKTMLGIIDELDQLDEFAEFYREEIADYYEDEVIG